MCSARSALPLQICLSLSSGLPSHTPSVSATGTTWIVQRKFLGNSYTCMGENEQSQVATRIKYHMKSEDF